MKYPACLSLLTILSYVQAHQGQHEKAEGETVQQYAQRHMASEHHIDTFDTRSFFQLHDLNRDGFWDRAEIEAIYGVHHVYAQKKSKDDVEHQKKADQIVEAVLAKLDLNKDGKISPEELESVGLSGLPDFHQLGAEGHHYDVESEFFLHHEEEFHSTPETQTDQSYNHTEDLEHFKDHEAIERKEAEKEAKFQGITVEEVLKARQEQDAKQAAAKAASAQTTTAEEKPAESSGDATATTSTASNPKYTRITPPEKQDPHIKYSDAAKAPEAQEEWGSGQHGFKPPRSPGERMRKNMPYKYKFKRNWGDF